MKKGIKTLAAAALAVSALTPVAAAAATPTATNVEAGVYTTTNFYSLTDFAKLSTADKVAVLTAEGTVVVVAGQVYKANDVLTASDSELEALGTSVDEYTTEDGNKIESGKPLDQTGEVIDPVVELTVESVSAITDTYVTVTFPATAADIAGATVEVKDSKGNVVEVKPLDIAEGDTTADFEFVTAIKAADLVGVWTVDGKLYDLDVFNKIADVLAADTQIELAAALAALNLENYNESNIAAYYAAQQDLVGTVEAADLTVEDIQKLVDEANKEVQTGTDEKALIKAIKDAVDAENEVAYLKALQNAGLTQVNPAWVTGAAGYLTAVDGSEASIKAIQLEVNSVNEAILQTAGTVTATGVDKTALTKSKELIKAYAPLNEDGEIANSDIQDDLDAIEIQLAVVAVLEATTPNALKAKLAALAALSADIDMDEYVDANAKEYYIPQIKTDAPTTAVGIQGSIDTGNTDAGTTLIGKVTGATSADELLKALKAYPGLKNVADTNKDVYWTTANGNFDSVTSADIQTTVDTQNLAAVTGATDASKLLAALKAYGVKNVVDTNKDAYKAAGFSSVTTVATAQTKVDDTNTLVAVNGAKTADAARTALAPVALAATASADYLELTAAGKLEVAELFLAIKVAERTNLTDGKYTNVADVKTDLESVTSDYKALLDAVNAATTIATMNAALQDLEIEEFEALTPAAQLDKAEKFLANYPKDADGVRIANSYKTIAAIKADLLK